MPITYTLPTSSTPSSPSVDEVARDVFGKDLFFNGDLQTTAAGDYVLIEGKEALRQAIYRRLLTAPGEYRVRPDYGAGVGQFVKKRMTRAILDELRQRIIDQLSQDDRIDRVVEVTTESYTVEGRPGIKVYVKVQALGQEFRYPFNFVENT